MNNIIQFTPRNTLNVEDNLRDFINTCATKLKPFGRDGIKFESNSWNIKGLTSKGNKLQYIYFTRLEYKIRGSKGNSAQFDNDMLLREPFLSFSKAMIIYMHSMQPSLALSDRMQAFRHLESALIQINGNSNPIAITPEVLNYACTFMIKNFSHGTAYSLANILNHIYNHMLKLSLVIVPSTWSNPLPAPKQNRHRIGKAFDEARFKKLPDPAAIEALAEIFTSSTTDKTEIAVSSLSALMLCCPDRATEMLYAPLDCLIPDWTDPDTGELGTGIRWFPLKGGKAMVKTIIPSMRDIALKAVEKLRQLGEPARILAKWYENNPKKIYLPNNLEHLRNKQELSMLELGQILFGGDLNGDNVRKVRTNLWVRKNNINVRRAYSKALGFVLFRDIETKVLSMLPSDFPIMDQTTGMLYSEALCIARPHEFNTKARTPLLCMISPIRYGTFATSLKSNGEKKSIFEKRGLKDKEGNYLFITTHMMRHYLNTLIRQNGLLTEKEIANWSGRSDISQNKVYDHVSDRDRVAHLRKAVGNPTLAIGPLSNIDNRVFVTRDEFANIKILTAHTTDLGHCIHDFAMLPCHLHADCINCNELVCVKGDEKAEANLRKLQSETKLLLDKAKIAMNEGEYGANEWVKHQTKTLTRACELISILDDPMVPNGSVIQLNDIIPASRLNQAEELKQQRTKFLAQSIHSLDDVKALLKETLEDGK